jgi:endonuclease-3
MKEPFEIDRAIELVRKAVEPYPKAAMFELYEQGFTTPFEQLVACIISIRTFDEITLPTARRLFQRARNPAEIAAMEAQEIDRLIADCSFHECKAAQIRLIAETVEDQYSGSLPCEAEILMSFAGVGLKCANLVLGIACDQPRVSADIHVHRVTNRWGYVETGSPERTSQELERKLPHRYWVEINRLLVPFGKHICTGRLPRCSTCLLRAMCLRIGVGQHR